VGKAQTEMERRGYRIKKDGNSHAKNEDKQHDEEINCSQEQIQLPQSLAKAIHITGCGGTYGSEMM
jgi:hypothetical protein